MKEGWMIPVHAAAALLRIEAAHSSRNGTRNTSHYSIAHMQYQPKEMRSVPHREAEQFAKRHSEEHFAESVSGTSAHRQPSKPNSARIHCSHSLKSRLTKSAEWSMLGAAGNGSPLLSAPRPLNS